MEPKDKVMEVLLKVFIFAIFVALFIKFFPFEKFEGNQNGEVEIAGQKIYVEIARNPKKQDRGLSDKLSMENDHGMLFVFMREESHSFWMKDMLFPLDIIFIDKDYSVIEIIKNAQPCAVGTMCPSILTSNKFKYAIELNAGWASSHNLKVGDKVQMLKI